MRKLTSKIIRPRLPHSPSRHLGYHPRRIVVLISGCALALTAMLLLIADTVTPVTPVHAFSRQSRMAGAVTFHDKGCEHCHGLDGIGTDRGPELSDIGKRWKKDRIARQIRNGGGGMPPFGDALQPDEVKNLVDYLAAKRKAPAKLPPAPPAAPKTSPADDTGV